MLISFLRHCEQSMCLEKPTSELWGLNYQYSIRIIWAENNVFENTTVANVAYLLFRLFPLNLIVFWFEPLKEKVFLEMNNWVHLNCKLIVSKRMKWIMKCGQDVSLQLLWLSGRKDARWWGGWARLSDWHACACLYLPTHWGSLAQPVYKERGTSRGW